MGAPTATGTRWFHPAEADPDAALRLFLLPYSGGGVSMYAAWPALLPSDVAGQRVQLPGRQDRHREPAFTDLDALVDALAAALAAELDDRPYGLFGHSMGALLAYRLAVALERREAPGPALVGASGWAPVGFAPMVGDLVHRPDAELVDQLRDMGSLPAGRLTDDELRTLVVPVLRADLSVCASYSDDRARIRCPIVGYCGRDDPLGEPAAMASWRDRTPRYLGNREFPGGHFFIHDQAEAISADLVYLLRSRAAEHI